jgi:large subunit ribosomal protein L27
MAHKKASGSARQHTSRAGNRLGIKLYAGEKVKTGGIIVRQRGTKIKAGEGVEVGRDHTLYALKDGIIEFNKRLSRTFVHVK